ENRRVAATIRDEMVRSFTSSRRQPRGKLRFVDSDTFYARVAEVLGRSGLKGRLARPLSDAPELDDTVRGKLYRALGHVTVTDVLAADRLTLARALDMSPSEISAVKTNLIRSIGQRKQ